MIEGVHAACVDVLRLGAGAGADGCTMYTDEMQDGVTNPAPIDGNGLQAQYAADDGGYLRLRARTTTGPARFH
ncbi:MAG TPA: hypothetical protein VM013_00350 [Dehalococcoidia bacterium]|nr:hypothetical protein [Dehalococcoidia bacterium]